MKYMYEVGGRNKTTSSIHRIQSAVYRFQIIVVIMQGSDAIETSNCLRKTGNIILSLLGKDYLFVHGRQQVCGVWRTLHQYCIIYIPFLQCRTVSQSSLCNSRVTFLFIFFLRTEHSTLYNIRLKGVERSRCETL